MSGPCTWVHVNVRLWVVTKPAEQDSKMATAMCNAARCFLIRTFNVERAKKRSFHSLGIKDVLVKRLADLRIEKPTPIQEKVSFV